MLGSPSNDGKRKHLRVQSRWVRSFCAVNANASVAVAVRLTDWLWDTIQLVAPLPAEHHLCIHREKSRERRREAEQTERQSDGVRGEEERDQGPLFSDMTLGCIAAIILKFPRL